MMMVMIMMMMLHLLAVKWTWAVFWLFFWQHQTNPASNFSSYRSSLKAAVWRAEGASDDRERVSWSRWRCLLRHLLELVPFTSVHTILVRTLVSASKLYPFCSRLSGCIHLWNDLYCVWWGVKLYSRTHQTGSHLCNYFVGRASTISQPTQPSIPPGSVNE